MLWTAQQLIQLVKDDMGLRDLPPTVSDTELLNRFKTSCLKEFSLIFPRLENFNMGREDLVDKTEAYRSYIPGVRYRIPKYITEQMEILAVNDIEPLRASGYADVMWPYGSSLAPDDVMTSVVSIQAAAAVGQNVVHALTWEYDSMRNWITLFHGWSTGSYKVTVSTCHDESLSTVPPTAMSTLRELAQYDLGQYIYNTIKRKNNVDTGVGTITLNIDDFQDYGSRKRDLLKELSEDANLDVDTIDFY
jgi:hypothetical protein